MTKKKRILAVIVAVSLLFVMLSFSAFALHNADHDCIGEGCSICAQINLCKNLVESLSFAVFAVIIAATTNKIYRRVSKSVKRITFCSPVVQKVKLLN